MCLLRAATPLHWLSSASVAERRCAAGRLILCRKARGALHERRPRPPPLAEPVSTPAAAAAAAPGPLACRPWRYALSAGRYPFAVLERRTRSSCTRVSPCTGSVAPTCSCLAPRKLATVSRLMNLSLCFDCLLNFLGVRIRRRRCTFKESYFHRFRTLSKKLSLFVNERA